MLFTQHGCPAVGRVGLLYLDHRKCIMLQFVMSSVAPRDASGGIYAHMPVNVLLVFDVSGGR
jgi:hypothetical protein